METEPVAPRWRRIVREAAPLVVLLAVAVKTTADGWRVYDFMRTDEANYTGFAWCWSDPTVQPLDANPMYTPLYACWYRLLLLLPVTPEYTPNVNHGLLLTLLSLLFYALVRRLGSGRWVGATAAVVVILNTRLPAVWPLPVHLATVLLAAGVLVGTYRRTALGACGPVGFAMLAACYVRHEFGAALLALLPVYLAAGLWACRSAEGRREFLPWAVPLLLAVGTCHATLKLPLPNGPRSVFAFGQHYAYNVGQATGQGPDLWLNRWYEQFTADFGNVGSFGQALRARPRTVAWHVGCNLDRLPTVVFDLLRPRLELIEPYGQVAHWLIVGVLGLGLACAARRAWRGGLRGPEGQSLRAFAVAAVPAGMVSGASVVLIYPREHYLVLPLFFLAALAVGSLPRPSWSLPVAPTRGQVCVLAGALAAVLLSMPPTATGQWTLLRPIAAEPPPPPDDELRETMTLLHAVERRPPTVVLSRHPFTSVLTIWMARPQQFVSPDLKAEGFRAFAARHEIGVVILDQRLREDARFATDGEFLALWNESDTGAFAVLKSPGGHRAAVRRDLLKRD